MTNGTNVTASNADSHGKNQTRHILVSGTDALGVYDLAGEKLTPRPNNLTIKGKMTSLAFKEPNFLYVSQEDATKLHIYHYDSATGDISPRVSSQDAPDGIVHLAWNSDKSVLIGTSPKLGLAIVWSVSDQNGSLTFANTIDVPNAQQTALDPSGKFFVITGAKEDKLVIVSAEVPYMRTGAVDVTPKGSAPKHGTFLALQGEQGPTYYYALTCSTAQTVQLFEVDYSSNSTLNLIGIQTTSSSGPYAPAIPESAQASTITMFQNYIVISGNSFTGNESDYLTSFALQKNINDKSAQLVYTARRLTDGVNIRHISVGKKGGWPLLIANQAGEYGLLTLSERAYTGIPNLDFYPVPGMGPQFIAEF